MDLDKIQRIVREESRRISSIIDPLHTEAHKMNKARGEIKRHNLIQVREAASTVVRKESRYLNVSEGVLYIDEISLIKSAPGTNGTRQIRCDKKRLICVSLTFFTDEQARQVFRGMKKKSSHISIP